MSIYYASRVTGTHHPPASIPARASSESSRSSAGFFSSAKSFFLPLGPALDPSTVAGYPIDMRVKARSSNPAPELDTGRLYVGIAQYALGAYERWLAGEGEEWLQAARAAADHLVHNQEPDGSWLHYAPFRHTFPLAAPWRCGMAQGEGASLLVRLHKTTGHDIYAEAALRALAPLSRSRDDDGVMALLDGRPWPEEYPTDPPSFVLNGAIFAMWALRDVGIGLDNQDAVRDFETSVDTLAASLHKFDTGWWSLYSLYPHPILGVASSFYHDLHITQLQATDMLSPRPELKATRLRWTGYASSPRNQRRAFVSKALFRMLVPRNRLLARRLPWTKP
jgi:heparosan-N-sulfate-glucuronate 5-epimerase